MESACFNPPSPPTRPGWTPAAASAQVATSQWPQIHFGPLSSRAGCVLTDVLDPKNMLGLLLVSLKLSLQKGGSTNFRPQPSAHEWMVRLLEQHQFLQLYFESPQGRFGNGSVTSARILKHGFNSLECWLPRFAEPGILIQDFELQLSSPRCWNLDLMQKAWAKTGASRASHPAPVFEPHST